MSESGVVSLRPRKARIVCGVAAVVVVVVFTAIAFALSGPVNSGPATFGTADRVAMVVLGVLGALGIMVLARPRVDADAAGIRVRNLVGGYDLPWSMVRAVRFHRGAPWASLELMDDDIVAVMAVQATDKEYAVEGVRALRALHAAAIASAVPSSSESPSAGSSSSSPSAGSPSAGSSSRSPSAGSPSVGS